MTTALSKPKTSLAKIETIVPKPTKTEIINAMVERARVKHELDEQSRQVKKEALEKKILALGKKSLKRGTFSDGYINTWRE